MLRIYIFYILLFVVSSIQSQEVFHKKLKLMGSRFDITVVEFDAFTAHKHIDTAIAEIIRIEKIISSWDANSETSRINRNAGIQTVTVCKELFDLIERSLTISKLTDGAFDISYASIDEIWHFDGSMTEMPSQGRIKQSVEKIGYKNIILNKEKQTVFLKIKGMKIGFGAIGKGYAADKTKELLISKGVEAGIINASGDMNTWGKQPNGENWTVAITNPMNKEKAFAMMPITNGAVVTSGDYEKFVIFNGTRYSHIINPKTGMPSTSIISVSVFASSAELADALATAIFVMGTEVGINRINQIPNIDCIIIDEKGNIHTSKNIKINENQAINNTYFFNVFDLLCCG
jgi:thiamine biosynthesis lipoprotein